MTFKDKEKEIKKYLKTFEEYVKKESENNG